MIRKYMGLIAIGITVTWGALSAANAELAVGGGEGKFKDTTEIASSTLHQGALAHVQVFLGKIDIHDINSAESEKTKIIDGFKDAAEAYRKAIEYAGGKKLNPEAKTDQDKQDISFFFDHMKEFGFTDDLSEKSVTTEVQKLLYAIAETINKTDVKKLSSDIKEQQKFFKYMLNVQFFLNSITTLFRIG